MKVFAENRRAMHDFEVLERFTAGIVLTGHETKSIKTGRVQIAGAHVMIRRGEVFVVGLETPSFQPKNAPENHDPGRTKKLLLEKREIDKLSGKIHEGLTAIPLRVFAQKGRVKIEIALARGLKKHDKREKLKKRESEKEIRRIKN